MNKRRSILLVLLAAMPLSAVADIAYDAASNTTPGVSLSWSHVPSGTPRAAIVFCYYTTLDTLGVTYGGQAMSVVAGPTDQSASGELQFSRVGVWLLDDVASGTQTVATTGTTNQPKWCYAFTVTADAEVEFVDSAGWDGTNTANPTGTITSNGQPIWVAELFGTGQDGAAGFSPLTDWTQVDELDNGTTGLASYRYDIVGTSNVTIGWTQTADDAFGIAAGFSEIASAASIIPAVQAHSRRRN